MVFEENKLILVADAHLDGGKNEERFFRMLEEIRALPPAVSLVFLGDIFDLWFALPGYESPAQIKFLQWCREESARRTVYFLEGNHEFFTAAYRKDAFSGISANHITGTRFAFFHGDRINRRDWKYQLLRLAVRNIFTALLMRIFKKIGPGIAWKIRHSLRHTNQVNKKYFPARYAEETIARFAKQGINRIFAGHFHECRVIESGDCRMYILPAFAQKGELGVYDPESDHLETGDIQQLKEKGSL